MRRSYFDFCVNIKALESQHPHCLELKFFALNVSRKATTSIAQSIRSWKWIPRGPDTDEGRALKEYFYRNYLLAQHGFTKIIRPRVNAPLIVNKEWWLELTPEIIKSAYSSKNTLVWLKNLVQAFGIDKVVFSSVLEKPPSMRDLLTAAALILDYKPREFDELIKANSSQLVGELYEI
ncbi:MAG TPA: hypothetical protein VKV31_00985 [bacterium]|nr:hypothetical protein [bacterium]